MQESILENQPYDPQSNFAKLINTTDYLSLGFYDSALIVLQTIIPQNQIETEYSSLISLIIDANYPNERAYNSNEIDFIRNLANSSSYNIGPHVFMARALLNSINGENSFEPMTVVTDIVGSVHSSCSAEELDSKEIILIDNNGNPIPNVNGYIDSESRMFYFFGEQLGQLTSDQLVTVFCNDEDFVSPAPKALSVWLNSVPDENAIDILCNAAKKTPSILNNNQYTLFPNPTTGKLQIKTFIKGNLTFKIYSIQGKEILNGNVFENEIDMSTLQNGIYLICLFDAESGQKLKLEKISLIGK